MIKALVDFNAMEGGAGKRAVCKGFLCKDGDMGDWIPSSHLRPGFRGSTYNPVLGAEVEEPASLAQSVSYCRIHWTSGVCVCVCTSLGRGHNMSPCTLRRLVFFKSLPEFLQI